ncbi:MAG: PKD domain-containing protein [Tannerellaceae bacterium]|jgi:PKD repeat protein|nr:PKD domain-containing protein [Tannerellaceae bacterium]
MENLKNNCAWFVMFCSGLLLTMSCDEKEWNPGTVEVTGDFDFSLSQEKAPAVLTITNKSVNGYTYLWKFPGGDPATSIQKEPVVTYKAGGTYEIYLSVGNGTSRREVIKSVTLQTPDVVPAFEYTYGDGNDYSPTNIAFTDQSTGGATTWNWTFTGGDPASSDQQNPGIITYANSGKYPVTLQVGNGKSNEETTEIIKVYPGDLLCNAQAGEVWRTPLFYMGVMEIGFIEMSFNKERINADSPAQSKSYYRLYISAAAAMLLGESGAIDFPLPASWDWDVANDTQTITITAYYEGTKGFITLDISSLDDQQAVFGKIVYDPIFRQLLPDELLQAMAASNTFTKVTPQ